MGRTQTKGRIQTSRDPHSLYSLAQYTCAFSQSLEVHINYIELGLEELRPRRKVLFASRHHYFGRNGFDLGAKVKYNMSLTLIVADVGLDKLDT